MHFVLLSPESVMNGKNIILTCKSVSFFSLKDEDLFFYWANQIGCVENISASNDEIYLHIESKDSSSIHDSSLRELTALFYRYNIQRMDQLQQFLNEKNKSWFEDNRDAFWHTAIFGNDS